jgi:hypothetical protein
MSKGAISVTARPLERRVCTQAHESKESNRNNDKDEAP